MTGQNPSPDKKGGSGLELAGLGVQMAASILVFVLAGQWLDRRLGGTGWVTIALAFVGFGATFYSLIRRLNRDDK